MHTYIPDNNYQSIFSTKHVINPIFMSIFHFIVYKKIVNTIATQIDIATTNSKKRTKFGLTHIHTIYKSSLL